MTTLEIIGLIASIATLILFVVNFFIGATNFSELIVLVRTRFRLFSKCPADDLPLTTTAVFPVPANGELPTQDAVASDRDISFAEPITMPIYGVAVLSIATFFGIVCSFYIRNSVHEWTISYVDQVSAVWHELSLKYAWSVVLDPQHGFVFLALNACATLFSHFGILIGAVGIPLIALEISHQIIFQFTQGLFLNEGGKIRRHVNPIIAQAICRGFTLGFFIGVIIFGASLWLIGGGVDGESWYHWYLAHVPFIEYFLYIPFALPFVFPFAGLLFHEHVYLDEFPIESASLFFGSASKIEQAN